MQTIIPITGTDSTMRHIQAVLLLSAAAIALSGCSDHEPQQHAHNDAVSQHQPLQKREQVRAHEHGGHDSHASQAALSLNDGNKWATDEALRHAMHGIVELMQPHLHQPAASADYSTLSHGIHSNIEYMVQNCKLEPAADAALHVIIGEMIAGTELLDGKQGEAARSQGVEKIAQALTSYTQYFDHPGLMLH